MIDISNASDMKGKVISEKVLSQKWGKYTEYKVAYTRLDGREEVHTREVQDTGNGATILLYNSTRHTVVLIKQFRLPTLLNGHETGVIIESIAGLVEPKEDTADTIKREVQEETGIVIEDIQYLFAAYATPGAKTEKIFFYTSTYDFIPETRGGLIDEQEDIEVLELDFDEAYAMIESGDIEDAKTIILLQWARINIFAKL